MMMEEGVVLGHFISASGIQVDPTKITIISELLVPQKQRDVRSFLGHTGYYRSFIKDFIKIASSLFTLLTNDLEFDKILMSLIFRFSSNTIVANFLGLCQHAQRHNLMLLVSSKGLEEPYDASIC